AVEKTRKKHHLSRFVVARGAFEAGSCKLTTKNAGKMPALPDSESDLGGGRNCSSDYASICWASRSRLKATRRSRATAAKYVQRPSSFSVQARTVGAMLWLT